MGQLNLLANVGIVALMYASAWPFLAPLTQVHEAPVPDGLKLLVALSAVANLVVIAYHYTVPAHPKFLMVPWRRALLRVHITSGTVEFAAGLAALLLPEPPVAARVMAAAALLFHVPSAFAQTPIVFGARAVMRPGYLMCIGLHAFCAVMLLLNPSSAYWVAATFLVFNVYVWCRVYYYLFDKVGLFAGARYSVSILAAGLTTTPAVLGPNAIVVLALGCAISMLLTWLCFARGPGQWAELVREKARDSALPDEVRGLFLGAAEADAQAADTFFDTLDADHDGALTIDELKTLLVDAALPGELLERFVQTRAAGRLDRARFREHLWPLREVRERAFLVKGLAAAKSERDKAALVFHRLDVDADGRLSRLELDALARAWSMPPQEVDRWLKQAGATAKGCLSFDDFHAHLRPVWRFIFYDVVEAHHGRREDMVQRALTAAKDASAQDRVRRAVARELAGRVPFLAEGGQALLEDVSASLVEERLAPGAPLFSQGDLGDTFYLVRAGTLRVTRQGERLAELTVGDYLGEGALLTGAQRSATVTAVSDVQVLAMTRASFTALLDKHAQLKASVLLQHTARHEEARLAGLHQALQVELLGAVPFLAGADAALRGALVQQLERVELPAGTLVFSEGDAGDAFYLVGHGEVRIVRGEAGVAELGAGSWFGEGALLSGEPRVASALTGAPTVLYRLPRAAFEQVLAGFADVARALRESHQARRGAWVRGLLDRSLVRRVPFLRLAEPELLDAVVQVLKPRVAKTDEVLVREGEPGNSLFLVVHGAVRVERDGLALAELTDGAFFGERAVLEAQPRQATVVALQACELLELERAAIERLAARWPKLTQHLALPTTTPSRPAATPHEGSATS